MKTPPARPARLWTNSPLLRFLGSLRLAMLLLVVLILACIVGTITESRFDTKVAQAYFYDAPWFLVWLLLLCLNLTGAVLVRYPWKGRQTGFIMTHAGIIALLAGAMIGRIWGVEGTMNLAIGEAPATALALNGTELELRVGAAKIQRAVDLELHPPSIERPLRFKVQDIAVGVIDSAVAVRAEIMVKDSGTGGLPALHFVLRSSIAPQPIEHWLALGDPAHDTIPFGPGSLRFQKAVSVGTEAAGKPNDDVLAGLARERHFVFSRMPDMNMTRSLSGAPTGLRARFETVSTNTSNPGEMGRLSIEIDDQHFAYPVAAILGQSTHLTGTPWLLRDLKYLPDFRLAGKEAVSASEVPNNPALVFEIVSSADSASGNTSQAECQHEQGECEEKQQACCPKDRTSVGAAPHSTQPGVAFLMKSDGTLRYVTYSKGQKAVEGTVQVGQEIKTGLMDWTLTVDEFLPHASLREQFRPNPNQSGSPGIRLELARGKERISEWVPLGGAASFQIEGQTVEVHFGNRTHPLPFAVHLDNFEVERNEGMPTPAGFKSSIRFNSGKGHPDTGLPRQIWMNHPASFPDTVVKRWLGTAYKFSQASWNPNDLSQTTLQVLKDPGWFLKWTGSLLICAGLFTMFYLKPDHRKFASNS